MTASAGSAPTTLKRSLSLPLITLYGLGTIIGAGIYVLLGEVAATAGVYAPLAFLLAAVIAGFTAFTYAELVARHPCSAAEAVYVEAAFKRRWLAGVVGWSVVAVGVVSAATITNGFVGYFHLFFTVPSELAITGLVIILGLIAAWGISESVWIASIITLLEIGGLLLVLITAGASLGALPERWPELLPPFEAGAWLGIVLGAFLAFYAFIGFEDMVNVAEEVKNPRRNLPLGIVLALAVASLFYVLVALVGVLTLPVEELARSKAPLAKLIEQAGFSPLSIGIISLVAVVNGAMVQIIMASRMLYGMARQHTAPVVFARINSKTRTPIPATILIAFIVLILALWFPLVTLAQITSFITLLLFALMNAALWRLKRLEPHPDGVSVYPVWVPVSGFTICVCFLLLQAGWWNA